jgi:putative ABC transport system permease protein
MGIELLAGRGFEPGDGPDGPGVAVIDEALARRYWPGRDPLGRDLWLGAERGAPDEAFRVVGVVESIRQNSLAEHDAAGAIYVPHTQASLQFFRLALALDGERGSVWPSVQAAVRELDPTLVLFWNDTMVGSLDASLILQRTPMRLLTGFAALGLFLGVLGVYGVMAWEFGRRRREIGLRMAIGSTAWGIARLLGREWLAVVGAGVALGVLASLASTRVLASLLYGTGPVDPAVLAVTAGAIVGAALLACVAPVRRALRVDPAGTLKEG